MVHGYVRTPDVHGNEIVFVAQDDLWLTTLDGGRPYRLTSDRVAARYPRFSPDGSKIAWTSLRGGGADSFVLDRATGEVTRLTYTGGALPANHVACWLDEEHLAVVSNAESANHEPKMFRVGLDGTREPLPYGIGDGVAIHPDGAVLTHTYCSRDSAMWKRYRGGLASKLWLDPSGHGEWRRLLPDEEAGCYAVGVHGDRFIFTSDMGAIDTLPQAQLYSVDLTGQDLRQHTEHTDVEGYVRDARSDGVTVVYTARGVLYAKAGLDGTARIVPVDLPAIDTLFSASNTLLESVTPDFGGDCSVISWRGAVHVLTHRAGPSRVLAEIDGVRYRHPRVLGKTGRIVWVRDDGTADVVETAPLDGSAAPTQVAVGEEKLGYILSLVPDPAGERIAITCHDNSVRLVDLNTATVSVLQERGDGEPRGLAFSPDGRYLVWGAQVGVDGRRLVAYDREHPEVLLELTSGAYGDYSPSFSLDGRYLCFLSDRTFDPMYGEKEFSMHFAPDVRPYLVPLRADEPAPFGPSADGWRISEVVAAAAAEASDQPVDEDATSVTAATQIDVEGFEARMVPLPVSAGRYDTLRCTKDGVSWIARPLGGDLGLARIGADGDAPRPALLRYSFTARKTEQLVASLDHYEVTGDGVRLVVRDKEQVLVVPADRRTEGEDPMRVSVDTSRLRRQIDQRAEWALMLRETHHFMALMYWREDMDGVDWARVRELYEPVVARLGSRDDLADLLWEMVAEMNTSHAYVQMPPDSDSSRAAAFLGADGHHIDDGWQIDRVLHTETTDLRATSPLHAAGVDARPGDVVVAVDGRRLSDLCLGEALQGSAGKVVELTLRRGETERRVAVVPVANERHLRYQDWVRSRRAYVEEHSGGRLGYVHVPDMGWHGWMMFNRDIGQAVKREGLVIDMRFNGGGNVSELIIERLTRSVTGWEVARHHEPWTYQHRAVRGPMALLVNQQSGSDGDIGPAHIQARGLAIVIGERTWGGVIGIDGRLHLVDGTGVTQPRYSAWHQSVGWGLENHGVDPDITVEMTPSDWSDTQIDVQLDVAIDDLLRRLDNVAPLAPPELPAPRFGK